MAGDPAAGGSLLERRRIRLGYWWGPNSVTKGGAAGCASLPLKFIEGVNNVAQQMESIGDLNGKRCPDTYSLADPITTVTRDDLGAGVRSQPTRKCGGLVVWQHVDWTSNCQIDQEQSVAQRSAVQGEFVHTQFGGRHIYSERLTPQ